MHFYYPSDQLKKIEHINKGDVIIFFKGKYPLKKYPNRFINGEFNEDFENFKFMQRLLTKKKGDKIIDLKGIKALIKHTGGGIFTHMNLNILLKPSGYFLERKGLYKIEFWDVIEVIK